MARLLQGKWQGGGRPLAYEKVKPLLYCLGTNLQYIGEVGSGQAIKLINNVIIASTITTLAEGMILADAQNLPREKVKEVLSDVPATSPFMKLKMDSLVNMNYPTLFSMRNMYKDLELAKQELQKSATNLPVFEKVDELFERGVSLGNGEKDISAVLESLKTKTSSNE